MMLSKTFKKRNVMPIR